MQDDRAITLVFVAAVALLIVAWIALFAWAIFGQTIRLLILDFRTMISRPWRRGFDVKLNPPPEPNPERAPDPGIVERIHDDPRID